MRQISTNQTLGRLLREAFDAEQIQHFLETVYNFPEYGACPLCGTEDIPVDSRGNPLPENATPEEGNNASWREQHDEDCLVTWLSQQAEGEVAK
jgi:hypothetical protein